MGLSILISILFLTGIYIYQKECGDKLSIDINAKREDSNFKYSLAILIVVALGVRLVIAYFTAGHPTDMNCWNAWGGKVSSEGLTNFYGPFVKDATTLSGLSSEYFCDYPPGYMYVLGAISHFINFFKLPETVVPLMYKLPGILCDMGLLIFFYKLAEKNMGKSVALWIGCIVAFIPIFVFNSAVWGQIESVLVLLLIASLYLLYKKKYMLSALLFVVSVLVKPQGLLVAPIYLFAFLETKDWKMIGKVMLASFALGFLLIIPFSPAWTTVDGNFFVKLLNSFNPLWLVEKYSATLGSYKFFTVNAFNFYGLLGFNWKPLDIQGMETLISILNWGIIALAIAISGFMYYKIKTPSGKIFMPAFMIIAFLFTFGFKMHERYMMPALAFLLCEYVFTRNKKLLWLCGGFSITTFLNAVYVLYTTVTLDNAMPLYSVVGVISMFEVALFILSVWVIIKDYMLPKKIEKKIAINKTNTESSEETQNSKKPKKALKKMVRADYLALAIITLAYSAIAFTNLGDTTAPQTFYKPLAENESFILELEDPANVSKITSYLGIGNVEGDAKLDMVASLDGNTWVQLESTATLESVFKWNVEDIVDFECKYIKCTPSMMDYTLFELAVWDEKGELVPIKSVVGNGESNYKNIVDEQKYAQDTSTYMNGTYFDEIYHPRTAYEHLHMMPYYETTHPPLGKLIMSIGVAIFGMTPFGWRIMGTLFGIFMLPLLYFFLKKMFGRTRYSVIGTLLFAFDFMHFSLTRMGTIDSYPVFFIIAMFYFMYMFGERAISQARMGTLFGNIRNTKSLTGFLAMSGIAWGLGAASKWIAIYAGAGLAVEFAIIMVMIFKALPEAQKAKYTAFFFKICSVCLLFFVAIPGMIYLLSYVPIVMTGEYGNIFEAMWNNQKYMLDYHGTLTSTHPYSSMWYQWPIDYKPLWAYLAPNESVTPGMVGTISIFGNPLLWWTGIAAFVYSIIVGIQKKSKEVLFISIALLAQYVPWMFVSRAVFIYHFFASTPFMVMFIIYAMRDLEERFGWFKNVSMVFVITCLLLFVAFYPVLTGVPANADYVKLFLVWFNSWSFGV